jgi:riboflavin transporter FmnP
MTLGIAGTCWHFYNMYSGHGIVFTAFLMGLGCGYLSVFVTSTAEHFGTNLRVTVTATVTNFMRGAVVLLIPMHQGIQSFLSSSLSVGLIVTGIIVWGLALVSVLALKDTFGKDLNYEEE